ncbi:hypothetical protein P7T05_03820 [Pantoea anthophila]|uniref:hypothetical protein n=1 Tax=Pantoea anthophila TaxID=470931 RepID=UPI002550CAFE|nr:hypothetical protein [Pantoea anthophila]WIM55700.1 hypothetical protein P7T05_03820 [Pantoea anthophila]
MTVIGLFVMFLIFKPNKNELIEIKNWKTRDEWQGNVITIEPKSWSQTDTRYGNDFFYNFNVPLTVAGKEKVYSGKGLVRPNDIHKLKRGIRVIVKYNESNPPKVAIIDILY